jgi:O-antigen/teichoic acid export membrane protein
MFQKKYIQIHYMAFYHSLKNQYKSPALKSMGIYTITNFFGKGLSFLLLPLFTNPKYLSPADNGLLSLFSQAIIFILPLINLGILQSASADYFKLDKNKFKDFCTTGFTMSVSMAALAFLVFFFARHFLYKEFSFPPIFIWAIPLVAFFNFCYELVILLIRNRDEASKYMKVNMARIITELGLAVILIVVFSWGWMGRVSSILIAAGVVALYAIYFLIRHGFLSGTIKKEIIYGELKYSVPIIMMQLGMFSLFSSDTFMLAGITKNTSVVGIYGMACVFGSILITLSSALIQYMVPKINTALSKKVIDYSEIKKHSMVYAGVMVVSFLMLLAGVPLIYHFFINDKYWGGIRYFCFLSTGYFFWTITIFLYTFLLFFKQKKLLLMLACSALIISLSGNYLFIKNLGSYGAAISVCCSYFLVMLLAFVATKKYWKAMLYSNVK